MYLTIIIIIMNNEMKLNFEWKQLGGFYTYHHKIQMYYPYYDIGNFPSSTFVFLGLLFITSSLVSFFGNFMDHSFPPFPFHCGWSIFIIEKNFFCFSYFGSWKMSIWVVIINIIYIHILFLLIPTSCYYLFKLYG